MIRKLRIKFVILSMISLLLLLGIIVISSNLLTYRELVSNADRVLDMIVDSGGHPVPPLPPEGMNVPEDAAPDRHPGGSGEGFCRRRRCMRRVFLR